MGARRHSLALGGLGMDGRPLVVHGSLGWHGDQLSGAGRAADAFADASGPCGGPYSTEVRLHLSGYIGSTATQGALATFVVDQYQSGPDKCDILRVRLYDFRYGTYRGVYYYYHAYRYQVFANTVYGNNQWYWNSWPIGYTTYDDVGCAWDGYHAHQSMPPQYELTGTAGQSPNTVYPLSSLLHGWIFWTWTYR